MQPEAFTKKDVEACKWLALSAAQGHAAAVIACDLVRGEMTPAQFVEG